ncbi:hypothetical protein GCM10008179_13200 [Hansschlegelia plantiphila]|uniref:Uncharacterized protein n=2 Tax=Hansschlegelia plantiphila TaxID=374655 RepID=A0A9W6IZ34_9HYPH|nr:hypothetical protein GCM10008179_13200 [Hansschlegelia plantiphila]
MGMEIRTDRAEALAMNLFRRDHPERSWRPGLQDRSRAEAATFEERALYRSFAEAQLAKPLDYPAPAARRERFRFATA